MFCYCGECPENIPKRESHECVCYPCADLPPEQWADDLNLVHTRCDKCGKLTFCNAKLKEDESWRKEYM